ncbi:uncharacterized protein WCI35_002265, partial [Daubentonia madagascariensis]
ALLLVWPQRTALGGGGRSPGRGGVGCVGGSSTWAG